MTDRKQRQSLVFGVGVVLALVSFFLAANGGRKIYLQRHEKASMETRTSSLKEENARLRDRVEKLKNNPETIQNAIRNELNMLEPDETLIVFDSERPVVPPPDLN